MNYSRNFYFKINTLVALSLLSCNLFAGIFDWGRTKLSSEVLKSKLNVAFAAGADWPKTIEHENDQLAISYTLDKRISDYVKKRIKRYRPEYVSVVMLDNNTGKILTALDYERKTGTFGKSMTFATTHPAASIFKIITTAELLENTPIDKESIFKFVGKSTTLYKYQLKKPKSSRWVRTATLKQAFALSNNVIYGKAAINNIFAVNLFKMAQKFGFNRNLFEEIDLGKAVMKLPSTQYGLAEMASGFNRRTMMSPVHGAMLASIIANNGVAKYPHIVEKVVNHSKQEEVWKFNDKSEKVISSNTASDIQEMMELTVSRGTARSSLRFLKRKRVFGKLRIGGKTGTITGGIPHGKRDWFVSYAYPGSSENKNDKGISLCVMLVNVDKWHVKAPVLAGDIINFYYNEINKL